MNTEEQMKDEPNEIWPTNKDEKGDYYYKTSICSFPGYITENAGSHFVANNESVGFIIMENTEVWPTITTSGLNDEHHPIPQKLYVAYYSLQEDKFYEGLFDLPYEELKKDFEKIWKSYSNKSLYMASKFNRYSDFIVGVAPEGNVVVWLSSKRSGNQKIIGTYKAKITNSISWEKFCRMNGMSATNTKENYTRNINKDPKAIPIKKFEQYSKQYNWRPKIEYIEKNTTPPILPLRYFIFSNDGEEVNIYADFIKNNNFKLRGVPYKIIFNYKVDDKTLYGKKIEFKEEDIYKGFETITKDTNSKIELVFQVNTNAELLKVFLRSDNQEYVLDVPPIKINPLELDHNLDPLIE